jgi:hypothetical protein
MIRRLALPITVLVLCACAAFASPSVISDDALDDRTDGAKSGYLASGTVDPAPAVVQITAPPPPPATTAAERTLSANPLWAMPLAQFPATRERPIFSPSRRPLPPALAPVSAPKAIALPRPKEPERPQLTLVGTIAGDEEGFGIFLDPANKTVIRLKIGEDFQGWKLRSVRGRETTLEKDRQTVTLALPQPGLGHPSSEAPPLPTTELPVIPKLSSPERANRAGR